ncbi:hypothetical protein [Streptomyces sp. NRRL S-87]|uniref:hypothetical protein n=1 Tax=Streptomyces sp. NRRL S-87 TaxID=1463920 RepID=UPI00131BE4F6|nr:hypothetical protein [Streptomyces sp. NRRL S-87]
MITYRLSGRPPDRPAPPDIKELLTAAFAPADRIEHLWARSAPGRVDLVLFLLADCEATALLAGREACLRALRQSPRLDGWHLSDDDT